MIGRVYFLSPSTDFQLDGYVSSGYFIEIDPLTYHSFLLQNSHKVKADLFRHTGNIIDLTWLNLERFFNSLEQFNKNLPYQSDHEYLQFLFTLLLTDTKPILIETSLPFEEDILFKFMELVENNFKHTHTVDFYATALRLYPKDLNQICKKATGKYAMDIVLERLINEAEHLLLTTKTPVKSIANQLGFLEPLHFTAYFEKFIGKTPLAYRSQ